MHTHQSLDDSNQHELLYFWAIGDLHYLAIPAWNEFHTQRLAPLFEDLHQISKSLLASLSERAELFIEESHDGQQPNLEVVEFAVGAAASPR